MDTRESIKVLIDRNDDKEANTISIYLSKDGNLSIFNVTSVFPGSAGIEVKDQNGEWKM